MIQKELKQTKTIMDDKTKLFSSDGISNEICLINELLKLKSDSIKNSLFDYNRELQNLQNYFSINQEKMV